MLLTDDFSEIPDPDKDEKGFADHLFDAVSGTLRELPEAGGWIDPPDQAAEAELRAALAQARNDLQELRRILIESDTAFGRLHEWITAGRPLPGPWRKPCVAAPNPSLHEDGDNLRS
ncbi:hypothetical protein ABZ249_11205 [Nocardiopsis sp. NPDC006139]|uniref:hypothetical protein n=1 Tax=Nocardiopsis sp. NPDC006139 TaxID=3154578 RepID=UPI0033B4473E